MNPFKVVHAYNLWKPLDLPVSPHVHVSEMVEEFTHHVHDLHHKISKQIHVSYSIEITGKFMSMSLGISIGIKSLFMLGPSGFHPEPLGDCKLHTKASWINAYAIDNPSVYGITLNFYVVD